MCAVYSCRHSDSLTNLGFFIILETPLSHLPPWTSFPSPSANFWEKLRAGGFFKLLRSVGMDSETEGCQREPCFRGPYTTGCPESMLVQTIRVEFVPPQKRMEADMHHSASEKCKQRCGTCFFVQDILKPNFAITEKKLHVVKKENETTCVVNWDWQSRNV